METVFIHTPLGIAKIEGDENGLTSITVFDSEEKVSDIVPELLEDAVYQLREYFEGCRKEFSLTLNPEGTDFQKGFGKPYSIFHLAKQFPIWSCPKPWAMPKLLGPWLRPMAKILYGSLCLAIGSLAVMVP